MPVGNAQGWLSGVYVVVASTEKYDEVVFVVGPASVLLLVRFLRRVFSGPFVLGPLCETGKVDQDDQENCEEHVMRGVAHSIYPLGMIATQSGYEISFIKSTGT
jgi:hypothetical protein